MTRPSILHVVASAGLALAFGSDRASAQDVVVMRRTIAAPIMTGRWHEGEWRWTGASSCSASAPRVRAVSCMEAGRVIDEARCRGPKPQTTGAAPRYEDCTHDWALGDYGDWSASCADPARRTRTVRCLRQDGEPASSDALCTAARPQETDTAARLDACGWTTTGWRVAAGCGAVQQTRDVGCEDSTSRSAAAASACRKAAAASVIAPEPPSTGSTTDYSTCGYEWRVDTATPWSSTCSNAATRTVTSWRCVRSDGTTIVDDAQALCGAQPSPQQTGPQTANCSTLVNGSFNDVGGWSLGSAQRYLAGQGPDGSQAMYLNGGGNCSSAVTQTFTTVALTPLRLNFRVRTNSYYGNAASVFVTLQKGSDSVKVARTIAVANGSGPWTDQSVPFTVDPYGVKAGDRVTVQIGFSAGASFGGQYPSSCAGGVEGFVDDVSIVPG